MLWKCCTRYVSKFGKLSSSHRTGKGQFIPIPKNGNAKECSNYGTIALISHASKVMLKILKPGLSSMWILNLQMFKLDCWKRQKNQRSNCRHPLDQQNSNRVPKKISISALMTMPKPLTVWTTQTIENSSRDGNTRSLDLPLEKSVYMSGSNS